jgi:hypothetical protein
MTMTRESLLKRYGLLSDEDLLGLLHSGDLTDLANEIAAAELRRRGVDLTMPVAEADTASKAKLGEAQRWPGAEIPVSMADIDSGDVDGTDEGSEDGAPLDGGDFVLLTRFFNPIDAYMLQNRLQADGVLAVVAEANIVETDRLLTTALGGVRVLVLEADFGRAREIMRAVARGDYRLDEQSSDAGIKQR